MGLNFLRFISHPYLSFFHILYGLPVALFHYFPSATVLTLPSNAGIKSLHATLHAENFTGILIF
jgi:hypothetical protein